MRKKINAVISKKLITELVIKD